MSSQLEQVLNQLDVRVVASLAGPRPSPIVGNWFSLPQDKPWVVYRNWSRQYDSDLIHLNVFGTHLIIINSQKAAKELFDKKSAMYGDRPRMTMINEIIGLHWHFGFMPQGPSWTAHRKIFSRDFNSAVVSKFHPLELKWNKIFLKNLLNEPRSFLIHIQHLASGLSLELSHGLLVQESGKPDPFINAAVQSIEGLGAAGLFGSYLVDYLPILKYIPSWFPFAGFKRTASKWRQSVDIAGTVPYSVATAALEKGELGSSVLSNLLDSKAFDKDDVRRTTAAMFANGSAATVTALSSFFLAMVLYPQVQARAQKELDSLLHGRLPDISDESSLPYITAIVKEVLRWNPAVPMAFPHKLTSDDSYNGYYLPGGSVIVPNSWAILHDPAVYGSDVDEFNPGRFLTRDGKVNPEVPDPQVAFGYGRRVCPARHLALSTLFLNIAAVLSAFEISPAGARPSGDYTSGLLSYPLPFKCNIRPRSKQYEDLVASST
ncbi:cytochrome P450 [Marasmius fiardii PR-910]|nr:cytochrome P450 [Marasmius fiardii PR-910]